MALTAPESPRTGRHADARIAKPGPWRTGSISARLPRNGLHLTSGGEDPGDVNEIKRAAAEALFFDSAYTSEKVAAARRNFPRKQGSEKKSRGHTHEELLFGEEEPPVRRRLPGFRLGFEKIFATTSIKLPVSAYTIYVELRSSHDNQSWSRCFNGLQTVFDLKKWLYEKLMLPMNAYELSYAESRKVKLTDEIRLLTTQESLDTRTMATTRAVQDMYKGTPGVHSIDDHGVTHLYVKHYGQVELDRLVPVPGAKRADKMASHLKPERSFKDGATPVLPGEGNAIIEEGWIVPEEYPHCLFNARGYELFQAARTHGGHADLARIFMSCNKEPHKFLQVGETPLASRTGPSHISY
eukprot:TRINITY_DN19264_c0_g1_i2.p1 TRINITY_DN19264_c0_g1~~TRINITY_DN19264_c0_g1_i2.p1  ORF type:complete len:372 (+),score=50.06 TRINITY_DN19264_c0_g1_i2:55-1116(+)